MTTTLLAHFDGKQALVLDEPADLPVGTPLRVHVEAVSPGTHASPTNRFPLTMDVEAVRSILTDPKQAWRPLDIDIDPELGRLISENPDFNIEES